MTQTISFNKNDERVSIRLSDHITLAIFPGNDNLCYRLDHDGSIMADGVDYASVSRMQGVINNHLRFHTGPDRMPLKVKLFCTDDAPAAPVASVTQTIAGKQITLQPGKRYIASRPFAQRGVTMFPVTIKEITPAGWFTPVCEVGEMTYDDANDFLNAFNADGAFTGRLWSHVWQLHRR